MPTHGAQASAAQDPIRYEHLVRDAEQEMHIVGTDRDLIRQLGRNLRGLVKPGGFWRAQSAALAVFTSPEGTLSYRIPLKVSELSIVGVEFQLAPLVPVARAARFAVLAVSRAAARLFEGNRFELREFELKGAPSGLDDITQYYELERQLQFRQASTAGRGTQVAMFHGHGIGEGRGKEMVLQYLRAVDESVRRALPSGRVPLLAAGPAELPALYGQVSTYGSLLDRHLELNPDGLDEKTLRERALELIMPMLKERVQEAVDQYLALAGTGRTSTSIPELAAAAFQGRVDTLLVSDLTPVWGTFDPESSKVEVHDSRQPGDRELINLTTVNTLRNGGSVIPVTPDAAPEVAAVFRF
ncbi:MAG: hypothetical protein ACE5MI_03460 [Acidimicrobiia bacterium]